MSDDDRKAAQSLMVTGRVGHGDFINGQFDLQDEVLNGKPVYRSEHEIPESYGEVAGQHVYLYYHADNDAWVLSHQINSLDVIGYAPSHIKNIWHINNGKGPFIPDPTVKLVTAANGQVLTNLGAWTVEPDGEVALKVVKDGPGSERPFTCLDLFRGVVDRYPDAVALSYQRTADATSRSVEGEWVSRTYRQYFDDAMNVAKAMTKLGLKPSHGVLIIGANAPEWNIAYMASILAGAFPVGVYPSSTPDDIHYIADQARANVIFVDQHIQLSKVLQIKNRLDNLVAVVQYQGFPDAGGEENFYSWADINALGRDVTNDSATAQEVVRRQQNMRANKCAVLAFTAGTSNDPRGVMLAHDNITWTARAVAQALGAEPAQDSVVSYLPLANVTVQMTDIWIPIASVGTVFFAQPDGLDTMSVIHTLRDVRPTLFFGVPWVWARLAEEGQDVKRLSAWEKRKGLKGSIKMQRGEKPSWKFGIAEKRTFSKIKKALGLDECRLAFCIDSNLPEDVMEYFLSINLPIYESYGSAESCGFHTLSLPGMSRPASVGKTFPGSQVRLTHGSHEIIMYGRHVFMGYLRDAELTAKTVDERGWLESGDLGQSDKTGFLYVSCRMSDMLLLAGGSLIPPIPIEYNIKMALKGLVDDVVLVGAKRKSLACLITLRSELDDRMQPTENLHASAVEKLKEIGINAKTMAQALEGAYSDRLRSYIEKAITDVNSKAPSKTQHVMKFELLARPFSRRTGEYSPMYKLKRRFIAYHYADVINSMYGGEDADDYEQQEWYHGPISRNDCVALQKRDGGGADGWFLVRLSTKEKDTFIITLAFKGKLYHNQIKYADGVYSTHKTQGDHQYTSLQELINHHKEGAHGFQTVLTKHCVRA